MKTYGNLILITVICIVIFWVFMALRPSRADPVITDWVCGEVGSEVGLQVQVITGRPDFASGRSYGLHFDELAAPIIREFRLDKDGIPYLNGKSCRQYVRKGLN